MILLSLMVIWESKFALSFMIKYSFFIAVFDVILKIPSGFFEKFSIVP